MIGITSLYPVKLAFLERGTACLGTYAQNRPVTIMREGKHPEIARISEVVSVMRARYRNSHGVGDYGNKGGVGDNGRNLAKYGGHFVL
jgi:hypothetical protein